MYDPSGLYVDPILTNLSVGFPDQNLYGLQLAPETPVNTKSGRYRVYDRSHWLVYRSRREPGTIANTIAGRKWSEDEFKTFEHSLQADVYWEEDQQLHSQGGLANPVFGGDLSIDPHAEANEDVVGALRLEHEVKVSTLIRDVANYPANHVSTLAGAQKWSDYTFVTPGDVYSIVSDPVSNLRAAAQRIWLDTARYPNTFVIPFDAVGVIENHPRVVDRFKNWSLSQPNAWQTLLSLPDQAPLNIIIADSKVNQADNIDSAEDIVSLWGQDVWLGIVDPTPGQKTKTFMKTFAQIYPTGGTRPSERWQEVNRKTDVVRANWQYDLKIVSSVAGYIFKTAVAAVS